ncbi:MAG: adenylate/guanylate cyclase domain-containing protein [Deltaproteobacteria bacterium]|nr:adenylate/guanylate cyclase domain-containing protein [Deltaproteobacteria bacterium]
MADKKRLKAKAKAMAEAAAAAAARVLSGLAPVLAAIKSKPDLRTLLPTLAWLVGLMVLTLTLQICQPAWLVRLDLKIQDAWMGLETPRPEAGPAGLAVLVDIDQASEAEYGPWPWPRFLLAELIQRLVALGAAAVGLDLDLSEPDRTSPERVAEELKKWRDLDLDLVDLPDDMLDYDRLLALVIEPLPVVLGARFTQDKGLEAAWPLPVLAAAAPTGLTGLKPDLDGVVRRVQLVTPAGGDPPEALGKVRAGREVHLALSLKTLLRALGREEVVLAAGQEGFEVLRAVAPWDIPLERDGGFTVFFKSSREYSRLSAGDVLAGRAGTDGLLKGRLVFISLSSEGSGATPGNPARPGGEFHAALIDNLAARRFIARPAETPAIQFLLILGAGLSVGLVSAFASPARALAGGLIWSAAAIGGSIHLFQASGLFVSPLYAVLAAALSGLVLAGRRLLRAGKIAAGRRRAFAGRTAPEIAARLARLPDDPLAVQEREVTVLAADLRDFRALSLASGSPAELLARGLDPMTELVLAGRGVLDQLRGDCLLAFWNAPLDLPGHPAAAVATALALSGSRPKGGLKIGLGLHTGPAWTGRLGPGPLARYTIMGEAVSLCLRLEKLGRLYGVEAAVSGAVLKGCGGAFAFQTLDLLRLPGLDQPLAVFAPLGPQEARNRAGELERQEEALALYREGEFARSRLIFGALSARYPRNALYDIFRRRCERLMRETPADWTGVWSLEDQTI